MKKYREWTAGLPGAGQFVVLALEVAAVVFVLSALRGHASFLTALVVGVIVSALLTPVAIARRRVVGRIRLIVEVSAAIRSGVVPAAVDSTRWMSELTRRRLWALRLTAAGAVMILVAAGFVLWAVLVSPERLEHILSAIFFAGAGGWLVISSLVQLPRIRRLRTRVEGGGLSVAPPRLDAWYSKD
jgi:hypothetical protein